MIKHTVKTLQKPKSNMKKMYVQQFNGVQKTFIINDRIGYIGFIVIIYRISTFF